MNRLATRGSRLALVQAEEALRRLRHARPELELELLEVKTAGDLIQDVSLEKVEGKGFFTSALEEALAEGRAAAAVHSLKDLPTLLPDGFALAAVLPREDPRDALVSPHGGLDSLPEGTLVGTDSSRRRAQLAALRPDLRFEPVRGNVPTRLRKLDEGRYGALVLAVAGLRRLGLEGRIAEALDPSLCLPAPGQGAIALETLSAGPWEEVISAVDDAPTAVATRAERSFLAALGGGCQTPVGCLAELEEGRLRLRGVVVVGAGAHRVEVEGPAEDAEQLGRRAAAEVSASGARL